MAAGGTSSRGGVTHTILERERLSPDTVTLPQMLATAGYTTGIFGKWHLGDEEVYRPEHRGFDEVCIHGGGVPGGAECSALTDIFPTLAAWPARTLVHHVGRWAKGAATPPAMNPMKLLYWRQFGGGPDEETRRRMDPALFQWPPPGGLPRTSQPRGGPLTAAGHPGAVAMSTFRGPCQR